MTTYLKICSTSNQELGRCEAQSEAEARTKLNVDESNSGKYDVVTEDEHQGQEVL